MESCLETISMMEKIGVEYNNIPKLSPLPAIDIPLVPVFDRFLFFVKPILEYGFGVYMGFVVGWLLGLFVGNFYVEQFKPLYFSDLNELRSWKLMPYDFARYTAMIGVIVGAIAIAIINRKLLCQRIRSLYEKEITEPKDIAHRLDKSERQIRRVISKFAEKGK